jgi:predicted NBD/HSP70 family sugar kinase
LLELPTFFASILNISYARAVMLALDIGGTKLAAALMDGANILERAEAPTPTEDRGPWSVTDAALRLLEPFVARASGLGVAATGSVAEGRVTALNSDTLQGWHAFDLRSAFEQATCLKTVVLNDADAAAWGEYTAGAGRGTRHFAFVTVSTGVGGGIVLGGNLHLTSHGLHAELGYTLAPDGQPIELVASGGALDRWARTRGWAGGAREVVSRAAGDAEANAKLDESARLIAFKLADLRTILGIERAAVGGGLGLSGGYLDRVCRVLKELGEPWNALEVVPAALGTNAGLVGAADWAHRST